MPGYFEAIVQLTVPWMFSMAWNEKGTREGTMHMISTMNLTGFGLFFLNWTMNSFGGAVWNIVYYLGAVNISNTNDPGFCYFLCPNFLLICLIFRYLATSYD
jgi:hypothetical protein